MKDIIKDFLPHIIENVTEIDIGLYYDVIYELVSHINLGQDVLQLCKNLTMRIQKEAIPKTRIKTKNQKDQEYSIIINKCFNILRLVCDNKDYILSFHEALESIFKELYDYLKNPKKVEFDEDLVLMLTTCMKHSGKVTNLTFEMLQHMTKFLKKNKGLMLDLYEFMNQIIVNGYSYLCESEEFCEMVYQIYLQSIEVPLVKDGSDKSPILGSLMIQTWITVSY